MNTVKWSNSSILPIEETPSWVTTTPGQTEPGVGRLNTHSDFFMMWDENLVPLLYSVQLYVILYQLICLFTTENSVLGYNIKGNLMYYRKMGVILKLTPRLILYSHHFSEISTVSINTIDLDGLVWFLGFYGISTYVGYLTPNPFLCK